jgi:hypothetical protein
MQQKDNDIMEFFFAHQQLWNVQEYIEVNADKIQAIE